MRLRSQLVYTMLMVTTAFSVASCDDDAAGPNDGDGRASATLTDDPAATAAQQMGKGHTFVINGQTGAAQFTGTISGDAAVEISTDGETWIALGSPQSFDLDAQLSGTSATLHSDAEVPVGAYSHVRLVLADAEARISAGSSIGGVVLNTDVVLMVGGADQSVTVEMPIATISVEADATTMFRFDMNAESWVTSSTLQAGAVSDAELSAAVTARTDVESS